MLNFNKISHSSAVSSSFSTDVGLRDYMNKVYNNMAIALLISGVIAFLASTSQGLMAAIYSTPLSWVVMFAPLVFVFFFNYKLTSLSSESARNFLWIFAALMGLSLSSIFMIYTANSIARVFFISSATFGITALYGYQTKKDLTKLGSFMIMGLIGIIIASLVNIFLKSSAIQFAVSILGVIVFIGLTAYDSQRIKQLYYQVSTSSEMVAKMAVIGALSLYMNFINLFMSLLHLFGERK